MQIFSHIYVTISFVLTNFFIKLHVEPSCKFGYKKTRVRLRVTTNDYESDYKWLQVNANDCEWLWVTVLD